MKPLKQLFSSILLLIALNGFAQNCDKLLEGGLYSFTKMTNTGSFSKDIRTYYLSEQFKSDMRSGKWGSSLTIPIEGMPFTIGMNDSDEKYSELRTKLLQISELNISSTFYQTSYSSIPNTNLYEAYMKCVEISGRMGQSGFMQGLNIETEETVVFTIYYKPLSPSDPMPKVTNFNVEPAGSIISGNLSVGQVLNGYTLLVTCRRHAEKDLILTLETDRGAISSKASAIDNIASNREFPIGTIITSYLNFEQFNAATKNNEKSPGGIWTSSKSKWAPCDGRPVPTSKFQTLTSQTSVPDLRGKFLRGLNSFDPYQPVPQASADAADPDTRVVGSYQSDAFQGHKHFRENTLVVSGDKDLPNQPDQRPNQKGAPNSAGVHDAGFGTPRVSNETRPKNVAIYYYIKIN